MAAKRALAMRKSVYVDSAQFVARKKFNQEMRNAEMRARDVGETRKMLQDVAGRGTRNANFDQITKDRKLGVLNQPNHTIFQPRGT